MFQKQGRSAFKKDLGNTIKLCKHLGEPQHNFKSVHVAGTNGKGSTTHSIAAVMQTAGYKTGLYTSPHLKDFTERIKINGQPIGEQEVIDFVASNRQVIKEIQPSFFEMTVAMAFDHFSNNQVDIAVIEVGLGGRLDSTNVINPLLSIITNIAFDHTDLLGESLVEIAAEKAGIIKPSVPVIISEFQEEIAMEFEKKAQQLASPVYFAGNEFNVSDLENGISVINSDNQMIIKELNFDLKGSFHLKNIPGIIKALFELQKFGYYDISNQDIRYGLEHAAAITNFKGRWQVLQNKPLMICDIAHNQAGIKEIMNQINTTSYQQLHIVWGMVKDKKTEDVLRLLPQSATYYFCQANIPRALPVEMLAAQAAALKLNGQSCLGVNDAIAKANQNAGAQDFIFVGGSAFIVAEIENL